MIAEDSRSSKKKLPIQSTAARPPTDSIYPVQAPYADLQGLTPPPEDFSDFLRDCPSLSIPTQYSSLVEPPTPPRTEAVSSPSRSLQSGCSSTKAPSSPNSDTSLDSIMYGGDATMQNVDADLGRVVSSLMQGSSGQLCDTTSDPMALDPLEKFFDFNSAASSPKPPANALPRSSQLQQQYRTQNAFPHQYQSSGGVKRPRDDMDTDFDSVNSPPAGVKTEFSPTMQGGNLNFGNLMDYKMPTSSAQVFNYDTFQIDPYTSPSNADNVQSGAIVPFGSGAILSDDSDTYLSPFPCELSVEFPKSGKFVAPPDPRVKSRVETQIAVRFGLTPIPDGVVKLRLPRHAIAKTKYIEDDHPQNSPEILELSATLVCASAMHKKDQRVKALYEARGAPVPDWIVEYQRGKIEDQRKRAEDAQNRAKEDPEMTGGSPGRDGPGMPKDERKEKVDYSHGLYGAPVQICDPCINRERKRASRKKHKKPEEEEKWALDETKRIIVFNTNQVRQLERPEEGSSTVYAETQMRICCYCRHHGEKEGFQVIFTVKDYTGTVVAQTISSTILITDDHKNSHATAAPMMHQDGAMTLHSDQLPSGQAPPQASGYQQQPGFMFHQPQPTHDAIGNYGSPPGSGFAASPRTLNGSTPPSPMRTSSRSPGVHEPKRRRGGKVPASLAMTPSDPSSLHRPQFDNAGINFPSRNSGGEASRPPQWMAGNGGALSPMAQTNDNFFTNNNGMIWGSGTDRNGFSNLLNSPPTSNIAPSTPMSSRQLSGQSPLQQQAALQHQDQQQVQYSGPLVSRVVPSEGTCRGGIEITVLGQAFHNGLIVMFGDVPATDTFYFSDTTLLCRLPPNPNPGPVVVSLKNYPPFAQGPNVSIFTYVDDVEKELMALALTVVGMKMKGELGLGTSKQIALSILRENGIGTDAIENSRNNVGNQRGAELEQTLLTLLDVIDMDESPHPASLGHKNKSGQAMLHLAAMLGMQKFVAALLARGVNANSRDKNGYTPLHFAVLYRRSDVVRRLVMNGANVGIRNRSGETAADLDESDQIARATRSIHQAHSRQHSRSSSVSSEMPFSRSRSGSTASIAAGLPAAMTRGSVDDYFAHDSENDSSDVDYSSSDDEATGWPRSRKGSVQDVPPTMEAALAERAGRGDKFGTSQMGSAVGATDSPLSPPAIMAAWMEAWREQLTQSFQNLQLSMPAMPTAQTDYQTLLREQMARFQYQVPTMPAMPRWGGFGQQRGGADYKWSELLHPPAAPSSPGDSAPPAYNELYPDGSVPPPEEKIESLQEASAAAAEASGVRRRTTGPSPSPKPSKTDLREIQRKIIRRDHTPTEAEQAEYRAQIQKIQRIQSDRRLYFFWIPVLVLIMLAMAYTHGPRVWHAGKQVASFVKQVIQEPTVVRERVRMGLVRALGAPPA